MGAKEPPNHPAALAGRCLSAMEVAMGHWILNNGASVVSVSVVRFG